MELRSLTIEFIKVVYDAQKTAKEGPRPHDEVDETNTQDEHLSNRVFEEEEAAIEEDTINPVL